LSGAALVVDDGKRAVVEEIALLVLQRRSKMATEDKVGGRIGFVRDATGLVREASALDSGLMNIVLNWTLGYGFAFTITWVLVALPGNDIVLAAVIALIVAPFVTGTWALLSASMPRTGGEYLYNTRILGPVIGFMGNWGNLIAQIWWAGIAAAWVPALALSPAFSILGAVTGNAALYDISAALATPIWTFIIGTLMILLGGGLLVWGLKKALVVLNWAAIVALIGFIVGIIVMIFTSHEGFVNTYNTFAGQFTGVADSYGSMIQAAKDTGMAVPGGHPMGMTLAAAVVLTGYLANSFWSAYMGGEIKGANSTRRQVGMMLAPVAICGILLILAFALLVNIVGYDFLSAVNWVANMAPDQYPFPAPPYAQFFIALMANNAVLGFIIAFLFVGWGVANVIGFFVFLTRNLFAWSFDRILPLGISDVSERFHSPVKSILIVGIIAEIAVIFIAFFPDYFAWNAVLFLMTYISFGLIGLAGLLFPYLKRSLFESSPANVKVGGLPVIVITGIVTVLFELASISIYYIFPDLGIADKGTFWLVLLGGPISGIIVYYIIRAIRSRQGVNLDRIFQEIPPE
jgi:amino acid transporter